MSKFVLVAWLSLALAAATAAAQTTVTTTTGGTPGTVPVFNGSSHNIENSSTPIVVYNGNVGVGTISPHSVLDVQGVAALNGMPFTISTTGTWDSGYGNGIEFRDNTGHVGHIQLKYDSTNHWVSMNIGGLYYNGYGSVSNQLLTILGNGDVGIGTSAPVYSLDVTGLIHASNGIVFPDGTTQTTAYNQTSFDSASLTTTQVGMGNWAYNGLVVGNGTSGQFSGICVGGALRNTGGAYNGFLSFNNFAVNAPLYQTTGASIGAVADDTVATDLGMSLQFQTLQSGSIGGSNALTERMRISSNGKVGIGTTSPGAPLEVNGSIKLTANSGGSITFQDGSVQTVAYTGVTCGGDYAESVDVSGVSHCSALAALRLDKRLASTPSALSTRPDSIRSIAVI